MISAVFLLFVVVILGSIPLSWLARKPGLDFVPEMPAYMEEEGLERWQ